MPERIAQRFTNEGSNIVEIILIINTRSISGTPTKLVLLNIFASAAVTNAPILVYLSRLINILAQKIKTITFPIPSRECDKKSHISRWLFIDFVPIPYNNPKMKKSIVTTNTNPLLKNESYPNSLSIYLVWE